MRVERCTRNSDEYLVLWLSKDEFIALENAMKPQERFTFCEGPFGDYRNLHVPNSKVIFIYEPPKDQPWSDEIKDATLAMANKEANLLEHLIQKTMLAYGCEVTDLCLHRKITSDGMEFSVIKKAESDARYPDIGMYITDFKRRLVEAAEEQLLVVRAMGFDQYFPVGFENCLNFIKAFE